MKLDFENLLEDRNSTISSNTIKELIKREFVLLSDNIHIDDISVKFHTYSDNKYDFYVTVKRINFKDSEDKIGLEYDENYRLREKEIIKIVNNFLKENYKIQIKQNESEGVNPNAFHFGLKTYANAESKDESHFFYRFDYIIN